MVSAVRRRRRECPLRLGVHLRFLRVDFHDDHAVGADPRRDAQDQAGVLQIDVLVCAQPSKREPDDPRHAFADLDERRLVVQRHDLGPAENFHPPRFLQGPDQDADALAGGRQHQAAVAEFAVDPAEVEDGRVPCVPTRVRAGECLVTARVAQRLAVEVEARRVVGGDNRVFLRRRAVPAVRSGRLSS